MKGIDEQRVRVGLLVAVGQTTDQEMAGEVHALNGQARAARDVDEDQREGDGDARPTRQDVVQQAVARVVVVLLVANKAQLAVDELGDNPQPHPARRRAPESDFQVIAGGGAHLAELAQKRRGVQFRVRDARHQQRAVGEVVVGAGRRPHELVDEPCSHRECAYRRRPDRWWPGVSSTSSVTCEISASTRSASTQEAAE